MGKVDLLYARLPVFVQNIGVSLYGVYWNSLRFGGNFKTIESGYRSRDAWSADKWNSHQQASLKHVLARAADHVPYYQRHWTDEEKRAARNGILQCLPLLEKEAVRTAPRSFVDDQRRTRSDLVFLTSGSTGTPIETIWNMDELREAMAVREVRSAGWAGVSFKLPRATFSGRMVEPDPNSRGPFYRFNAAEQQVYFSAFHLRPDTARAYVEALERHKVAWLTGYAVSFYLLSMFMLEKGITPPPIKAVITTSEKLTPEMRAVIERALRCPVFEEYSCVENTLFASECERGRLHISPEVGVVEILRPDGLPCTPGEVGEVVATSLMRRRQPFIRYRLGDLAAWDPEPCPCGRNMPVIKEVLGRIEDVVIGPDGRRMVRFHGIFVNQTNIREGQVIQETIDHIRVRLVPTDHFSSVDAEDVVHRIQQRLGPTVQVTVETVNQIPRTKSGKFKAVVSLLGETDYERK